MMPLICVPYLTSAPQASTPDNTTMAQVSLLVSFLPHHYGRISLCHPIVAMVENAEIFKTLTGKPLRAPLEPPLLQSSHWLARCTQFEPGWMDLSWWISYCVARPLYLHCLFPSIPFSSILSGFVLYMPSLVFSLHSLNVILRYTTLPQFCWLSCSSAPLRLV